MGMSAIGVIDARDGWRVERAVAPPPDAPLRLTTRGRVVVALLAGVVVACGLLWGGRAVASGPSEPIEVRVHVVEAGETLWQHAAALAEGGRDVRDVVDELVELNNLRSTALQTGQQLLLPVGAGSGR
jgi:hypothetical protein